jgi:23S rRNA pseudouridine1911/1915/1917 synthase
VQQDKLEKKAIKLAVPEEREGQRLDHYLVEMVPSISRSRLTKLIHNGSILVNGGLSKAGIRLKSGDKIEVNIPDPEPVAIAPEEVPFGVLYEDHDILVIAKPPGVVVHPAAGHKKGTLVHGLLHHCDNLPGIGGLERPGIVHRLDKDTSGVMVIAKTDKAHQGLVKLFKGRQVKKVYHTIVAGRPAVEKGCIRQAIGRHRSNRKKMAVLEHGGRDAVTSWSVLEKFQAPLTYIEARPETGRTHQIRVHMAHLGHPVAGDAIYGTKLQKQLNEKFCIKRQCLHAYSLAFAHPVTGEQLDFVSPIWPDMQEILEKLRKQG